MATREETFKNFLRAAREILLNAQVTIGPLDPRWKALDKLIGPLEDEITKKPHA